MSIFGKIFNRKKTPVERRRTHTPVRPPAPAPLRRGNTVHGVDRRYTPANDTGRQSDNSTAGFVIGVTTGIPINGAGIIGAMIHDATESTSSNTGSSSSSSDTGSYSTDTGSYDSSSSFD